MRKSVFSIFLAVTIVFAAFGQDKRYNIESAIIKKKIVMTIQGMPEQTISSVQYFADFGEKESAETVMSFQGQTLTVFTMMKDGYVYSANITLKQGTKVNLASMEDYKNVNYLNLTDDIKKKYQIQSKGTEQVLGKTCNLYDMNFTTQGQSVSGTVWVWNGLVLKSKINAAGTIAEEETTEIQEGARIANEKFELPEGINFMEIKPQL